MPPRFLNRVKMENLDSLRIKVKKYSLTVKDRDKKIKYLENSRSWYKNKCKRLEYEINSLRNEIEEMNIHQKEILKRNYELKKQLNNLEQDSLFCII